KGVVWYQIFPERFANGDTTNDPEASKVFINELKKPSDWEVKRWTSSWFEASEWEKKLGGSVRDHLYERRYGGDIQGIINRLDYLEKLGVGAIYLNPVFEAVSLHKYDGSTYHHIDVNFGPDPDGDRKLIAAETPDDPSTWFWTEADKLFLKLIEEAHSREIRIVIDGVFNHTGVQFWAFRDIVKNGENSKYKDWYKIKSFDDITTLENEFDYKGWWDIKSLPEFKRTKDDLHPGPKQYVFHSTSRWLDPNNDDNPSDGIDGWRLDVARDVPLGFWKDWSKLVRSINHDAIIIGELWELSPDFISEEGAFNSLMNYNFTYAANDFFIADKRKISVSEFIDRLEEIDKTYPDEYLHLLQNLMGSHDTERLASLILNPDRNYDRDANEGNPDYNPGKPGKEIYDKQNLILAFQMTYRGAPMIYYGDEVGMWGAEDPHCRKPMVWDDFKYDNEVITKDDGFEKGLGSYTVEQNKDLLEFYKKMIQLRNGNIVLEKGDLNFLYSNNGKKSFAFERVLGEEKMIVAFNIAEEEDNFEVPVNILKGQYEELMTKEDGNFFGSDKANSKIMIKVPAQSFRIYKIYSSH
ncbi:MAG: glycoside hydrolase family 13 protein, partial [Ignavibacteria bacterium]|nr:glycoside hydrolase family 13 protein [Ignavibacteria bacterium]